MKKTIKLALVAAMAMGSTSAFATNGDVLIGIGAKARGMGGVGIGMSQGAESALANPAMITSVKGTEISFGGTIFMPDVEVEMSNSLASFGSYESDADMNVIPAVSIAQELDDGFYVGVGMWGTAGMGVDYRGTPGAFNMVTNLQLMSFGVPIAYKTDGLSVAVTPILQYGALDIDYSGSLDSSTFTGTPGTTMPVSGNAGVAQDLAFGYNIGLAYDFAELGVDGLTVGAVYKSAIEMDYKDVLPNASASFVMPGMILDAPFASELEQPAEIGIGASYAFMGGHTVAMDVKEIQYGSATGYQDFGWEDQTVIAVGYEYDAGDWAARAGWNHGDNPIKEGNGNTSGGDAALNMFNLLGFPGVVEDHFTLGGSYQFSKQVSVDLALAYAAEVTETYSMGAMAGFGAANPTQVEVTHSQTSVSVGINYNF